MNGYDPAAIESKWQAYWEKNGTFRQPNPGQPGFDEKPKMYILDMFPYPSGAGLHVGHPEGYTATDIMARYRRMTGCNVLHPMGYDAFGLPAEQYAVEHGVHPRETTQQNIDNIERQIRMFGFSYDWSRRVATTDVDYYKWTQWIFLQIYNSWFDPDAGAARPISELIHGLENDELALDMDGNVVPLGVDDSMEQITGIPAGRFRYSELTPDQRRRAVDECRLAYMAEVPVNWCPQLGTVLANEEVTNEGRSERGNYPVYRRALKQWMLRITAYAERLLADIDTVNWPEPIKIMQRNWIGKSVGAEVDFPLESIDLDQWFDERAESGFPAAAEDGVIRVYTTRPDTLHGATYMVLAPEHPLVKQITTDDQQQAVTDYVAQAVNKSELERTAETKEKTGVFTGAYAINPVNRERVPIWVADYVLMGYGTGAIMAVPAHDDRDHDFAMTFDLPIRAILKRRDEADARYMVSMSFETFSQLWETYQGEPSICPQLRGIGAGPVTDVADRGEPFKASGIDPIIINSVSTKRMVFVGPAGLEPLISASGATVSRDPVPFCEPDLSDELEYIQSDTLNGLAPSEGKAKITDEIAGAGTGRAAVNYKLRDWLFSRQRYWGEPFPIVHCPDCGTVPLAQEQLPLTLPEMDDFQPEASDNPDAPPRPPLGKMKDWANTPCPACGREAQRELNTMPQWAGSCWYYLRYLDPDNDQRFCDPQVERYWMAPTQTNPCGGVDLYVGGAEHAVLHLLYARFWHKVLYDLGHVSTPEPFGKLFNQGMIRSFAYRDARGMCVGYEQVDLSGDKPRHKETGEELVESVEKMSKSLRNVVNPDDVIAEYGADTFRLYEMFMGPLEASKPWNTQDVPGVHRFLGRIWRIVHGSEGQKPLVAGDAGDEQIERQLHKLIKKVGEDVEAMKFNTAIAAMMEFVNACYRAGTVSTNQAERLVLVLAPFAPHLAEQLWQDLGHQDSLAWEPWPSYDESLVTEDTVELPVQVNGKLRGKVSVPADADKDDILAAAKADTNVALHLEGKTLVKEIVVPGRLVNLVVKG